MYPPEFEYLRPESLDEALGMLDSHGEDAKVLGGGQSLIPLMKLRFAEPPALVDINRVPGLDHLSGAEGGLRIGALVRHRDCERSPLLRDRHRLLGDAARLVSDPIVRNLGTVAGSLAHADPLGDWASVMLAAGAEVRVRSASGARAVPIDDFLLDPFTTALEPNELIEEIHVPDPGPRTSGTYLKLERRVGDFATVGVAVQLSLDDGRVRRAGIGLTAVAPINLRAVAAEEALTGAELGDEAIREAGRLAAEAAEPHSDLRGSAEYKRNVIRVFVERGLRTAAKRIAAAEAAGPESFAGHETLEGVMDEVREKGDA